MNYKALWGQRVPLRVFRHYASSENFLGNTSWAIWSTLRVSCLKQGSDSCRCRLIFIILNNDVLVKKNQPRPRIWIVRFCYMNEINFSFSRFYSYCTVRVGSGPKYPGPTRPGPVNAFETPTKRQKINLIRTLFGRKNISALPPVSLEENFGDLLENCPVVFWRSCFIFRIAYSSIESWLHPGLDINRINMIRIQLIKNQ